MIDPLKNILLRIVVATAVTGWTLQAGATDFVLENNFLTVTNSETSQNLTVGTDGMVDASFTSPITPEDYGMPSFSFDLTTSDIQTGEHIFWAAVLITGNNNDKYLRGFLDEIFITVDESGAYTGEIKSTTNLTVRVESEGEDLQIELDDKAVESVYFLGETLHFDANNFLELLGAGAGQSAKWQGLAEDFTTPDSFSYKIYLAPRTYGVQGARIGVTNADGFQDLPKEPAPFINNEVVYVIEGGFDTVAASQPPSSDADAVQSSLDQIDLSGTTVSAQTLTELDTVVDAAATLAVELAADLDNGSTGNSDAIDALTTLGNVLQASATASTRAPDAGLAQTTRVAGIALLSDTAAALDTLNLSTNSTLTSLQRDTVQQTVDAILAAAGDLAQGNSDAGQKRSLTRSIGLLLSSEIDLGITLTQSQTALARTIAETASSGDSDNSIEQLMAHYAIPITPRNTAALSLSEAEQALLAAGGNTGHAAELVAQLEATVNSNDLFFQDANGVELSVTGFADRVTAAAVAADPAVTAEVTIDESTGRMAFTAYNNGSVALSVPARMLSASLAPAAMPDGLALRADGSLVLTNSGVSVNVAPASHDPVGLFTGLRDLGEVNLGEDDGNITIDEGVGTNFRFSGVIDYRGNLSTGNAPAQVSLDAPVQGSDASDLNYRYTVTYPDGTQQGISPFVEADAFYTSLRDFGLTVATDRNSGVISIDTGAEVLTFRPAYFIEPQSTSMLEFWQSNADQHGIAYRVIDWNQDGRTDVAIITRNGFQIVYGL